jgi:hypothetical protein
MSRTLGKASRMTCVRSRLTMVTRVRDRSKKIRTLGKTTKTTKTTQTPHKSKCMGEVCTRRDVRRRLMARTPTSKA